MWNVMWYVKWWIFFNDCYVFNKAFCYCKCYCGFSNINMNRMKLSISDISKHGQTHSEPLSVQDSKYAPFFLHLSTLFPQNIFICFSIFNTTRQRNRQKDKQQPQYHSTDLDGHAKMDEQKFCHNTVGSDATKYQKEKNIYNCIINQSSKNISKLVFLITICHSF